MTSQPNGKRKYRSVCIWTCLFVFAVLGVKAQLNNTVGKNRGGFAMLELFTSEGCSSCPPAEALLEKIDQASKNKPIYVLAYHVDYWDRLGWKDAFSQHSFSSRQYDYSRKFSGRVYTPQLVINGAVEGVGSDKSFVNEAINNALDSPAAALHSELHHEVGGVDSIFYNFQGQVELAKLVVAIIQKHATSVVTRGENKGRILSHVSIVKALKSYSLTANKGGFSIELPNDFNESDFGIISFIQNNETGRIMAAGRSVINKWSLKEK